MPACIPPYREISHSRSKTTCRISKYRGLTLTEVMMALGIFSIVISAAISAYSTTSQLAKRTALLNELSIIRSHVVQLCQNSPTTCSFNEIDNGHAHSNDLAQTLAQSKILPQKYTQKAQGDDDWDSDTVIDVYGHSMGIVYSPSAQVDAVYFSIFVQSQSECRFLFLDSLNGPSGARLQSELDQESSQYNMNTGEFVSLVCQMYVQSAGSGNFFPIGIYY